MQKRVNERETRGSKEEEENPMKGKAGKAKNPCALLLKDPRLIKAAVSLLPACALWALWKGHRRAEQQWEEAALDTLYRSSCSSTRARPDVPRANLGCKKWKARGLSLPPGLRAYGGHHHPWTQDWVTHLWAGSPIWQGWLETVGWKSQSSCLKNNSSSL